MGGKSRDPFSVGEREVLLCDELSRISQNFTLKQKLTNLNSHTWARVTTTNKTLRDLVACNKSKNGKLKFLASNFFSSLLFWVWQHENWKKDMNWAFFFLTMNFFVRMSPFVFCVLLFLVEIEMRYKEMRLYDKHWLFYFSNISARNADNNAESFVSLT